MLECGETDLDFYSRRAMEEAQAATAASSGPAGAAHRHMAAAYAVRLRAEEVAAKWFDQLLCEIDAFDPTASSSDDPGATETPDTAHEPLA